MFKKHSESYETRKCPYFYKLVEGFTDQKNNMA